MPTFQTLTSYVARPVIDLTDIRFDGLTGTEEDYGKVKMIRRVTQERRASGDVGRLLDSREHVEVIAVLDSTETAALIASLTHALMHALRATPPKD